MYYLWHLRRRVWYRQYLPSLAHLQPIQRLTSMVLHYKSLRLRDIDQVEYEQWRKSVKKAVLARATNYYTTADYHEYNLYPRDTYSFQYRGQAYLNNAYTTNLAQIAMDLRHDRLRGVPSPWEHKPCVYCGQPQALNGRHLLQCPSLPTNLLEERAHLIEESYPELTPPKFAQATVACVGAHEEDPESPLLQFLCKSLALGRKIMRSARQAVRHSLATAREADDPQPDLSQLFEEEVEDQDQESTGAFLSVCSLQSLSA